jgi:hypothetical protein
VLLATSRFHHPAHAAEWVDPAIDAAYNDVWQLLMDGLCVAKALVRAGRGTAGSVKIYAVHLSLPMHELFCLS